MTTAAKSYFRYHLRSKWKLLLMLIVIALIATSFFSVTQKSEWTSYDKLRDKETVHTSYDSTLGTGFALLLSCGSVLPVTEFAIFKKRRNLDCFYSLPISRRQMGIIHYITGILCLVIPYTFAYLLNFLFMLCYPEGFYYWPLVGYYFISLLIAISAYSINVFLFNRANTTGDGIWFILFWIFLLPSVVGTWNDISLTVVRHSFYEETELVGFYDIWEQYWEIDLHGMGIPWGALSEIQYAFADVIEKEENASLMSFWGDGVKVQMFLLWLILGIASVIGIVFSFGKGRTEKTEEVSDSWFGFKLMIPLYATLLTIYCFGAGMILILIATFIAYIIYRKGFHLKLGDWIVLAALFHLNLFMLFIDFLIYSAAKG